MSSFILQSFEFDGKGGGIEIPVKSLSEKVKSKNLTWLHMDGTQPETTTFLQNEINYLDPFVIEALIAEESRPRLTEINTKECNGALLILRGVNLNKDAAPEDMVSIRLWVDQHRIISVRKRKLKAVLDMEQKIRTGKGPKDTGEFINMLITRLFERMEPVLTELDDHTDDIEEKVIERADSALRQNITNIRKQAIMLRRYMAPQKDAIGQLNISDIDWLNESHRRHLHENHQRIIRYVEDLDAIRERAQIVKDELANMLSDKLNKNMYFLSVISAIFLPLGFLTGLLGINVGGIPGAENSYAFMIFIIILAIIVGLQIYIFKKLKWF